MVCYRQASYASPLRVDPSRRPGRYHRGDEEEATQYLCLHPLGPLAELMRAHSLRAEEQLRLVRARTWALRLELDGLLEITFASAAGHGIEPERLVDDDQSGCRELAVRLRRETPGLIVPSAALPGTRNVVLFGPRVVSPYLDEPVTALDVPASVTADGARPLRGLLEAVRFQGELHAELEAWRHGEPFPFGEPDWSLAPA